MMKDQLVVIGNKGADDIPIESKVTDFEALLAKELRNNPDAAPDGDFEQPEVPKRQNFLKRK